MWHFWELSGAVFKQSHLKAGDMKYNHTSVRGVLSDQLKCFLAILDLRHGKNWASGKERDEQRIWLLLLCRPLSAIEAELWDCVCVCVRYTVCSMCIYSHFEHRPHAQEEHKHDDNGNCNIDVEWQHIPFWFRCVFFYLGKYNKHVYARKVKCIYNITS